MGGLIAVGSLPTAALAALTPPALPETTIGNAVFTGRNTTITNPAEEKSHEEIFERLYGGNFELQTNGLDYAGAGFYIQRIPDRVVAGQPTPIGGSAASLADYADQAWSDNFANVEAHYRFAGYRQSFGYTLAATAGKSTGAYEELLTVDWQTWGDNYASIDVDANMDDLGGSEFNWARGFDNGLFSSDPSKNRDGRDHLITYKVVPIAQQPSLAGPAMTSFLLFWEDQTSDDNMRSGEFGDWDYNDLVVEVRASYTSVPEPATLGLIGIASIAMLRRNRA